MPSRDDFITFNKMPLDPSDPGGRTVYVRGAVDEKAYQAAMKAWELFTGADSKKNQAGLYATLVGRDQRNQPHLRAVIDQDRQNFMLYNPANGNDPSKAPANLQQFEGDRVQFINVVQKASAEQSFGNLQKPVSSVNPTNQSNYTGQEQLNTPQESRNTGTSTTSFTPDLIRPTTASAQSSNGDGGDGGGLDAVQSDHEDIVFPDP